MAYDEDLDDDGPSRKSKPAKGKRLGQGRRSREEKRAVIEDIVQQTLANCAPVRQGQIFAVQPGNHGAHLEETIAEALWKAAGRRSIAAAWLGMSLKALEARIANSETLQDVEYEIEQLGLDVAECQLDALINAGVDKAVIFKLKSKGKARGWAENRDVKSTNSLTLDAARELESRLVTAFQRVREIATEAVIVRPAEPAVIESKPEPAPAAVEPDDEELSVAGFRD